ncbi:beta-galactosidase [Caulobacter sp. 602-2]|uniref:beta-galactosidase n=1 Tax=Caulobacter sp. 602-2 TaxID=2710887 RepID=A0A6G4R055_9CAUL|nr:glycoside hydrolase family 2 TIM barrel-domain containing protein [Caulobacter sp. 602-2]NGM50875.1 beta-galactosidase [Caulobacter sp. 602-2]
MATAAWLVCAGAALAQPPRTETLLLSGPGPEAPTNWSFVIDGGARAGEQAKIPVPSNWQLEGFGHYQYGYDRGPRAADTGVYRTEFVPPAGWKDSRVRIVFDGVMTDTRVSVNGASAGPLHQGGFNRFSYDITDLIKLGERNTLEVTVNEASAAKDTDIAERHGDYWVFGGIYRPVWLEAAPKQSIGQVSIDAKADGTLAADVTLGAPRTVTRVTGQVRTASGEAVGEAFSTAIPDGGAGKIRLTGLVASPALWSAETPNLYRLDVTLYEGDKAVHAVTKRFGFRTFEIREGDGLYLNGQRILLKGVNRHSFRPDTGRAISREAAYEDARTIRALNMNAVRLSHYAAEEAFLEAADELGLYVIDELSGWQHAHDTEVGRKLVRELVERDVNHPSIILWTNGNEGGWNRALDVDFALYDPQNRPVLHPWELFGGVDTKHYPRYPDLLRRLSGKALVMPTEFLHGLYDGGGGSGLDDYWRAIKGSPKGAGGFLWNLADEGVVRRDQGGRIDTYAAYGPDGLVGPRHEKEPSYFTVKEVWSPIQIDPPSLDGEFDGRLTVRNDYDFTDAARVKFSWSWVKLAGPDGRARDQVLDQGVVEGVSIAPHGQGALQLPTSRAAREADVLRVRATLGEQDLWTWSWPTARVVAPTTGKALCAKPRIERLPQEVSLSCGSARATFDARTGLLKALVSPDGASLVGDGPRLVVARPKASGAQPRWAAVKDLGDGRYRPARPGEANLIEVDLGRQEADGWAAFKLEVSADEKIWKTVYDGARVFPRDGLTFSFPAQSVAAVRISNLAGVRDKPKVASVRIAYEAERFAAPDAAQVAVSTGEERDPNSKLPQAVFDAPGAGGLERARWTLRSDGVLALDYAYALTGDFLYHGVGLASPLQDVSKVTARLRGPSPVWKNRQRGTGVGVYPIAAGEDASLPTPQRAGYFADPRWVSLSAAGAGLTIYSEGAPYLQLGARLGDFPTTSVDFPATDLGFMQAIPAMGAKGQAADLTGPAGAPAKAAGQFAGRLVFVGGRR